MARQRGGRTLREDLAEWFQSLRFSALTATIAALVIAAAVILTPSISLYTQQQREISQLRESVELGRQAVSDIEAEQLKWQDPVYIRAQARDRLFYVMPGEVQLSVIDDGVVIPDDPTEMIQPEIVQTERNWALMLTSSVLQAGTTSATPNELQGISE